MAYHRFIKVLEEFYNFDTLLNNVSTVNTLKYMAYTIASSNF